jgi:hypothetical protein
LAPLLHESTDEFLGVGLKDLVYFIENCVDIFFELVLAILQVGSRLGGVLRLLGVLGAAALLTARLALGHDPHLLAAAAPCVAVPSTLVGRGDTCRAERDPGAPMSVAQPGRVRTGSGPHASDSPDPPPPVRSKRGDQGASGHLRGGHAR